MWGRGLGVGGGVALLQASAAFEKLELSGDEVIGASAVKPAREAPLKQITVKGRRGRSGRHVGR
jgi:chaperonin GroEL